MKPTRMTFNEDDCYLLFLLMDDCARSLGGKDPIVSEIRERLLPVYRAWHAAHPGEIHPISQARYEILRPVPAQGGGR